MGKQYKNISEMINALSEDQSFKDATFKTIKERNMSRFLFYLRCQNNLTQKDLAKKLGYTQSRISKIEAGSDSSISIKDLNDYANAMDLNVEVHFQQKGLNIVDLIKYHAMAIKTLLNRLTAIAKDDDAISKGVHSFLKEAYFNINKIISDTALSLMKNRARQVKSDNQLNIVLTKEGGVEDVVSNQNFKPLS